MKKSGIERNIIILAIFIVLAVGISGFLVNSSLTQIVNSIHNEASTDFRLIVIKDISLDLLEIENNIQIYAITKSKSNIENYEKIKSRLRERIGFLSNASISEDAYTNLNDSIKLYVETKLEIWDEIRKINVVKSDPQPQFEELYSMLEKKEIDTVKVEIKVEPPKKKGIFRKIFGKKDSTVIRVDTNYVERTVENEEIRDEIEALETGLKKQERRKNRRELQLIENNIQVTGKLNKIIAEIETAERDGLIEKNDEADRLATIIYKRLSAFSIAAVVLLFVVLYLFVRYLQKSRKVQKELINAKQGAEKLAKAKEVFMANVSHEMRTPVNAIYGISEQLLQEKSTDKVYEKHSILLKSSKHLKEVVNDTLDFSKIQANKLKIQNIDFSPDNVINEVRNILNSEAVSKHIDLIFSCDKKLPKALLGDPFRLKQVLINTVGNAIKFTEKGSVTLLVEYKKINAKLFHLTFEVNDTGIGISEESLELIFEEFVQIETDYTRRFGGTGLGLSIVKKLIELQKGEISIKSKLNSGTKVSFHIPYKTGISKNIEEFNLPAVNVPYKVKELKVLGVDDDEYNRYILRSIFDKWGLEHYSEAKNGNAAVELALGNDFDLILMDLRMPDLNGIEASKLIVKEKPDSNIVALATINNEEEMKMCKEAGMTHFLSKPYAETELLNTIINVLRLTETIEPNVNDFDLKELERLANGDKAFMKEMIQIFIRSSNDGMQTMKLALKSEDWLAVSEAAHKMTASCKHINASVLYGQLKQLEKNAKNIEAHSQIPELILLVERNVETINAALAVLIESEVFNNE